MVSIYGRAGFLGVSRRPQNPTIYFELSLKPMKLTEVSVRAQMTTNLYILWGLRHILRTLRALFLALVPRIQVKPIPSTRDKKNGPCAVDFPVAPKCQKLSSPDTYPCCGWEV